jgi:hypothetical protein
VVVKPARPVADATNVQELVRGVLWPQTLVAGRLRVVAVPDAKRTDRLELEPAQKRERLVGDQRVKPAALRRLRLTVRVRREDLEQ